MTDPASVRSSALQRITAAGPAALAVLLLGRMLGGCGEPPPRRTPTRAAADKAALYGDAALVPTREGEQARAEVALAEELRQVLETMHAVERARVTVNTDRGRPVSAVVVLRVWPQANTTGLGETVQRLAGGVLGPGPVPTEVEISAPDESDPIEDPSVPKASPLLLLAILGLGISLGLTFDRTRALLRRRRR